MVASRRCSVTLVSVEASCPMGSLTLQGLEMAVLNTVDISIKQNRPHAQGETPSVQSSTCKRFCIPRILIVKRMPPCRMDEAGLTTVHVISICSEKMISAWESCLYRYSIVNWVGIIISSGCDQRDSWLEIVVTVSTDWWIVGYLQYFIYTRTLRKCAAWYEPVDMRQQGRLTRLRTEKEYGYVYFRNLFDFFQCAPKIRCHFMKNQYFSNRSKAR